MGYGSNLRRKEIYAGSDISEPAPPPTSLSPLRTWHKIEALAIERNNSSMGSPVSMDDQPARILYRSQMPSDRRAGSWSARRFDLIYRDGRWGHKNGGHDHRVKKNSSAARLVSCRSFHNSDAPGHVEMRRTRTTRQGDWSIGSQPTTNS
jgi:hypothetical protein